VLWAPGVVPARPVRAGAAINPKITVSDLSLTPSNAIGEENPSKTAIQSGDYLKLKFSWDASKAQAKGGDSFEIALPEQVRSKDKVTEPMMPTHVAHRGVLAQIERELRASGGQAARVALAPARAATSPQPTPSFASASTSSLPSRR